MMDDAIEIDNPPAFPVQDCGAWQCHGMSLRDWFAGQFLAGSVASQWFTDHARCEGMSFTEGLAKNAYMYADAMLAERDGAQ